MSLRLGEPLSVTRTVTLVVPIWLSLDVQVINPPVATVKFDGPDTSPKANVWLGQQKPVPRHGGSANITRQGEDAWISITL